MWRGVLLLTHGSETPDRARTQPRLLARVLRIEWLATKQHQHWSIGLDVHDFVELLLGEAIGQASTEMQAQVAVFDFDASNAVGATSEANSAQGEEASDFLW